MMEQSERPRTPGPRPLRFVRSLSLKRQLPLLMSTVLAGILATSLILTYDTLRRATERAVRERLDRAARQVASTVEASIRARVDVLRRMALERDIRRLIAVAAADSAARDSSALAAADSAARQAISRHLGRGDSALAVEIWDAGARRVLLHGPEARVVAAGEAALQRMTRTPSDGSADSVRFSTMYVDGGNVHFWALAPVLDGRRRVGYIAQQRRVSGPRETPRVFQELLGDDAILLLRNTDGDVWANAPGDPIAAPIRFDTTDRGEIHERPATGWMLSAEARMTELPWSVVVESPLSAVLADARETTRRLAGISLLLMAVGAAVSWLISRRIARPLVSLTSAAEALARGENIGPIRVEGTDEIGRLAKSFNQMASEVTSAHRELEQRVVEAQSTARALERANADLQSAMDDAQQARREAERASRAKGDFLAVMSHELRTPLNAIAGYAQLLELGVHGPLNTAQLEAVSRISRSQAHLLRLINDVLSFSKIDAGRVRYEIEDVPVQRTLDAIEPLVAPQMEAKGLAFSMQACDGELAVRADREKLTQILINLLSNAIKFTPSGGRVSVDCEATDEQVRIRVADTGPGIAGHQLESIFDPFVQGDRALNRPHEGVGLGLAISHDLSTGMGAELNVESEVGKGATFTITLERSGAALSRTDRKPYLSS
jgi:signal transduction histidine kinase